MTSFTPLAGPDDWYPDFRRRITAAHLAAGVPGPTAELLVDQLADPAHDWTAATITAADGRRIGQVVVGVVDPQGRAVGRIVDLWTDPRHDPDGEHHRAGHTWAADWCARNAARRIAVRPVEPHEAFAAYPLRSQVRFKAFTAALPGVPGVTARPMTADEYAQWAAEEQEQYAADIVRSGSLAPEDARRRAEQDYAALLPQGMATPATTIKVLEADGTPVGVLWLNHGHAPDTSYLYSVSVHEAHRGRGFGRAAMAAAEQAVLDAGDHALMFNVFGGNDVAMNLYDKSGYRVVEETRALDL